MKNLTGNKRTEKCLVFTFYFALLIMVILGVKINAQNLTNNNSAVYIVDTDTTPHSGSMVNFDYKSVINAESLIISGNQIASLPAGLFIMTNLEELSVVSDNVTEINRDIKNLYNLRVLDLSQTSVQNIPDEIRYLKLLKEIHLPYAIWAFRTEEIKKITNAKIILE